MTHNNPPLRIDELTAAAAEATTCVQRGLKVRSYYKYIYIYLFRVWRSVNETGGDSWQRQEQTTLEGIYLIININYRVQNKNPKHEPCFTQKVK